MRSKRFGSGALISTRASRRRWKPCSNVGSSWILLSTRPAGSTSLLLKPLTKYRNYEPLVLQLLNLPFEELVALGNNPDHSLTLILLLDQFTRNFGRGTPFPFTKTDPLCQRLAEHFVITLQHDNSHPPYKKIWYYLPFGHSENVYYQELSVSKTAETCWNCRPGREWEQFHEMMRRGMESKRPVCATLKW